MRLELYIYELLDTLKSMPVLTMQKHDLYKTRSNPRFQICGRPIDTKWYHVFDDAVDASELRTQIVAKENMCNTKVEIRIYIRRDLNWELFDDSSPSIFHRHFIAYHVCMRGGY